MRKLVTAKKGRSGILTLVKRMSRKTATRMTHPTANPCQTEAAPPRSMVSRAW